MVTIITDTGVWAIGIGTVRIFVTSTRFKAFIYIHTSKITDMVKNASKTNPQLQAVITKNDGNSCSKHATFTTIYTHKYKKYYKEWQLHILMGRNMGQTKMLEAQ